MVDHCAKDITSPSFCACSIILADDGMEVHGRTQKQRGKGHKGCTPNVLIKSNLPTQRSLLVLVVVVIESEVWLMHESFRTLEII